MIAAGVALLWFVSAVLVWLARRLIYLGIGVGIGYQIAGWAPRPVPAGAAVVRVQAAEVAAFCDQLKGRAPGSTIGLGGVDFFAVMEALSCAIKESDDRLRAVEPTAPR